MMVAKENRSAPVESAERALLVPLVSEHFRLAVSPGAANIHESSRAGVLVLAVQIIHVIGPILSLIPACLGLGAIMLRTLALRREPPVV